MATEMETKTLQLVPPDLPIAQLPTINLARLQGNNSAEGETLFQACQTHGFFYLDLSNSHTSSLLEQHEPSTI